MKKLAFAAAFALAAAGASAGGLDEPVEQPVVTPPEMVDPPEVDQPSGGGLLIPLLLLLAVGVAVSN